MFWFRLVQEQKSAVAKVFFMSESFTWSQVQGVFISKFILKNYWRQLSPKYYSFVPFSHISYLLHKT